MLALRAVLEALRVHTRQFAAIHKLNQLKLSDEGMCWYKDLDSYTALAYVYEHQGTLYHLHSESVDSSTGEATL
jgi:hypothetical protein